MFKRLSDSWTYMVVFGVLFGTVFDGWWGYIIGAIIGWNLGDFGDGQEDEKEEM